MIKWTVAAGAVVAGLAFASGFYVGWQTTLRVADSLIARRKKASVA